MLSALGRVRLDGVLSREGRGGAMAVWDVSNRQGKSLRRQASHTQG